MTFNERVALHRVVGRAQYKRSGAPVLTQDAPPKRSYVRDLTLVHVILMRRRVLEREGDTSERNRNNLQPFENKEDEQAPEQSGFHGICWHTHNGTMANGDTVLPTSSIFGIGFVWRMDAKIVLQDNLAHTKQRPPPGQP